MGSATTDAERLTCPALPEAQNTHAHTEKRERERERERESDRENEEDGAHRETFAMPPPPPASADADTSSSPRQHLRPLGAVVAENVKRTLVMFAADSASARIPVDEER